MHFVVEEKGGKRIVVSSENLMGQTYAYRKLQYCILSISISISLKVLKYQISNSMTMSLNTYQM